jgi:hypothetical protein
MNEVEASELEAMVEGASCQLAYGVRALSNSDYLILFFVSCFS